MAKYTRIILRGLLAAGLVVLASPRAGADVIGLTCDSCWGSNPLGEPVFVEDFEDTAIQPGVTFGGGGTRGLAESWVSNATPSGIWGYVQPTAAPLDIFFNEGVTHGGMFFGHDWGLFSPQPAFNVFLSLYDAANTFLGEVSVAADMGNSAQQFIGFDSSAPVTRAQLRYGETGNAGLGVYIDDLMFGRRSTTSVPEPATLMLMGVGAGSAVLLRRRKNRARR